jgi:transcriptional regulator of nitric oxide reductase
MTSSCSLTTAANAWQHLSRNGTLEVLRLTRGEIEQLPSDNLTDRRAFTLRDSPEHENTDRNAALEREDR